MHFTRLNESVKHGHTVKFKTPESMSNSIKIDNSAQGFLDLTGDDLHDVLLTLIPEELDHEKLKLLKSSKNIVKDYKLYISGEIISIIKRYRNDIERYRSGIIDINKVNPFVGIVTHLYEMYELIVVNGHLSEESFSDFLIYNYFPEQIEDPKFVSDLIKAKIVYTEGIIEMFKQIAVKHFQYFQLTLTSAFNSSIELSEKNANAFIKIMKREILNKSHNFEIVDIRKRYINFNKFGGGIVYFSKNIWIINREIINVDRLIIRAFNYDVVVCAHGESRNGRWGTEDIVVDGKHFVYIDELVYYLVNKKGVKSILLLQCNPGHFDLDDIIVDNDIVIHHSMNETIIESFDYIKYDQSPLRSYISTLLEIENKFIFESIANGLVDGKWSSDFYYTEDAIDIIHNDVVECSRYMTTLYNVIDRAYDRLKAIKINKAKLSNNDKMTFIGFTNRDKLKIFERDIKTIDDIFEKTKSEFNNTIRVLHELVFEQIKLINEFKDSLYRLSESESFNCVDDSKLFYTVGEALSLRSEFGLRLNDWSTMDCFIYNTIEEAMNNPEYINNPSIGIYEYYIPDNKIFGMIMNNMWGDLKCCSVVNNKLPHCRKVEI